MVKFNATKAAAAQQAIPSEGPVETRLEVLNLDDSQLDQVGGGDSTPNWQDPPTP